MRCEDFVKLLPEYLKREISTENELEFEEHMNSCPDCRDEFESSSEMWNSLDNLSEPAPSENMRNNFYAMLEEQQLKSNKPSLINRLTQFFSSLFNTRQLALSALTLLIGISAGYIMNTSSKESTELRTQVDELKQQVSLSLLKNRATSDRLQGIVLTSTVKNPDTNTLQTLLDTLNNDPSSNVRLSAVDALYLFRDNEMVKDGLVKSLEKQSSPMVQMALIELISEIKEKKALKALKKLLGEKSVNPQVKKQAEKTAKLLEL